MNDHARAVRVTLLKSPAGFKSALPCEEVYGLAVEVGSLLEDLLKALAEFLFVWCCPAFDPRWTIHEDRHGHRGVGCSALARRFKLRRGTRTVWRVQHWEFRKVTGF